MIRDSVLGLLDLVEARKGTIASAPINQYSFAQPEFAAGSDVDVGLPGFILKPRNYRCPA